MNIEVGKFYKTRGGKRVRIYATDGQIFCPIHGAHLQDGQWLTCAWASNGRYAGTGGLAHEFDIVSEWRESVKVEGWINVYRNFMSAAFPSKEEADNWASSDRIACVYVSGVEGVGPNGC